MDERRLEELLRSIPVPGEEEARERGLRVVLAAREAGAGSRRRPPARPRRLALVLAALALLAVLVSPAGASVRDWIAEVLDPGREDARPSLTHVPRGGSLLVETGEGAWVVGADGSKRRLGGYREATFSPGGRFVAAVRGDQLLALETDGTVRWSLARRGGVGAPDWKAPDGYRIAYLNRADLRVVAGDGTGDQLLERGVDRSVGPAWRPGSANRLAYVDGGGRVVVRDADSGRMLLSRRAGPVERLLWSGDGRRLFVVGERAVTVLEPDRGTARTVAPGAEIADAAASRGGRLALILEAGSGAARSRVVLLTMGGAVRQVFSGPGELTGVTFSPDGRALTVGWPSADQWLFMPARGQAGIEAVSNVTAQFDPGPGRGGFPVVRGWIDPPPSD